MKEPGQRAAFHYAAGLHDKHGIGQMSQNSRVVADHQEGCAEGISQVAEQGRELHHQNRVESGKGLVGDDQ